MLSGALFRQQTLQAALSLLLGGFFNSAGDGPDVTGRILDPCGAVAPELVLERHEDRCPCSDGALEDLIDVLDIEVEHDRRASVILWRAARGARPFTFDHHHGRPDRDRCMTDLSVRPGSSETIFGAKSCLAEFDLRHRVSAEQPRNDDLDPIGDPFVLFCHAGLPSISVLTFRVVCRGALRAPPLAL